MGKIRVKITAASRWWAESGEILSSEGENNPGDLQFASTPPHTGLSGVLGFPGPIEATQRAGDRRQASASRPADRKQRTQEAPGS